MAAPTQPKTPTPTSVTDTPPSVPASLIGAPVARVQMHVGVMVAHQAVSSLNVGREKVKTLTIVQFGVLATFSDKPLRYVIPFSNIESIELEPPVGQTK